MKFTCTKENLIRGVNLVSHLASRTTNLPILANVLLEAKREGLRLVSTNLEIGISVLVRGKVDEEGTITVDARVFASYIQLLGRDEQVSIATNERGDLEVKSRGANTKFRGMPADDFPILPEPKDGLVLMLPVADLWAALNRVVFTVATDEARIDLSGVLWRVEGDTLTLTGTDSYRLAEAKINLKKSPGKNARAIVPARTMHELARLLSDAESEEVKVVLGDNQISVELDGASLVSRLIEGKYPDYEHLIPKEFSTRLPANTDEVLQLVKAASLFCKPGINDIVMELKAEAGKLSVSAANAQVGESLQERDFKSQGKDERIVFNYRYLVEGLQNLSSVEMELALTGSASPAIIRPKGNMDYLYLVMPIKQ